MLNVRKPAHSSPARLNLVTEAIVLWNTVYLERAVAALHGHGQPVDEDPLRYLSPPAWEHINLTGDHLWRSSAKIGGGKLRLLRPIVGALRTLRSEF